MLELLVTLVIVGILVGVGIPSLKSGWQGSQLIAATNELQSALYLAHSEARKSGARVSICESSDGATCSATGDWSNGWIVFHDPLGDLKSNGKACDGPNQNCLLRVHSGFTDNQLTVTSLMDVSKVDINSITFTSRGLPKANDNISESGIFSVCSFDDNDDVLASRAVVLNMAGRSRVSDNTDVITCPTP